MNNSIINKSIQDIVSIQKNNKYLIQRTIRINKNSLIRLPEKFHYSLFQEEIIGDFELRVFYFMGKCFSSALFKSTNKADIRQHNKNNLHDRLVPYKLDNFNTNKIKRFMDKVNLESGSLDFLVKDGVMYFLEVNPVGQFDYVDGCGNYKIDQYIALQLQKIDARV